MFLNERIHLMVYAIFEWKLTEIITRYSQCSIGMIRTIEDWMLNPRLDRIFPQVIAKAQDKAVDALLENETLKKADDEILSQNESNIAEYNPSFFQCND